MASLPPQPRHAVHRHGGVVFWGAVSLVFAVASSYFYWQNRQNEQIARTLRDQEDLIVRQNQTLKAEVDKLQSKIQEAGSLLKSREQTLREKEENLAATRAEKDRLAAERQSIEQERQTRILRQQTMVESLKNLAGPENILISNDEDQIIIRFPSNSLFQSGTTQLKDEGKNLLVKLADAALRQFPDRTLAVEGHTDNESINGPLAKTYPTNWELSSARATTVVRFLVETGKVPAARLVAMGRGDSHPIASNETKEGKIRNRRVEIILQRDSRSSQDAATAPLAPASG